MSIVSPRSAGLSLVLVALSLLPSCRELNPRYCEAHPADLDCVRRGGIDAGGCTSDKQCPETTPICDIARAMCVQCTRTEIGVCGGTTPVCGGDDTCRGCALDAECASQSCLPDQSCSSVLDVLYVSPRGSDVATCMPDDHCSLARALSLVDGTKSTVRLDPAVYHLPAALVLPDDLHLVGRDAVLQYDGSAGGQALTVLSGTHIAIDYITVQGGDGTAGDGLQCFHAALTMREVTLQNNGGAGLAALGCALAISQSRIANNQGVGLHLSIGSLALTRSLVLGNQHGGLIVQAAYDLENNIIAGNGGPGSGVGGAVLSSDVAVGGVFAFNTVARNQTSTSGAAAAPGVSCGGFVNPVVMTSNIVFDNGTGAQLEGTSCVWTYSDIGPLPAIPVGGTGNLSSDPRFVDPDHGNFHLQAGSPARDAADPAATLAVDIDGEPRPQGARRDLGADEIP